MSVKQLANNLSSYGRGGDSLLIHMQPEEVAGLQALAKSQGTSLTINPQTGLPEAFNLGGFFRSLAPTLAGIGVGMIPGMQGIGYGIAAGALTGAALNKNDPLMGAVMGGMGGYGGSTLASSALGKTSAVMDPSSSVVQSGFNAVPTNVAANMGTQNVAYTGTLDAAGNVVGPNMAFKASTAATPPIVSGPATTGFGSYNPALETSAGDAARFGLRNQAAQPSALAQQASGFADNASNAFSNVANDPMGFIGQNKMAIGAPLVMAGLEGMQPNTLQMGENPNDKYDPYATLNLGGRSSEGESGLRLLATGGPVSFAAGGESMQGGGAGAMQGADSINVRGNDFSGGSRELGLFASQAQIDQARAEIEAAQAQARQARMNQGYMGMGGINQSYVGMGGMNQQPSGMASIGMGLNRRAPEEDINSLNLGTQESLRLANGGTIQAGGLQDLYGSRDDNMTGPALSRDGYGLGRLNSMAAGGMAGYKKGGYLDGPGDGMSDSIPATIEGKQPARLADGEFVIPADVVSHLGNGSTKAGSKRLYAMLDKVRTARTGNKKQGKQINPNKFLPA